MGATPPQSPLTPGRGNARPGSVLIRRAAGAALVGVQLGPGLVLVAMWIAMTFLSQYFLTEINLKNLVTASTVVGALAVGQLLVIITGGIDISVGSTIALTTVAGAKFAHEVSSNAALVIVLMLGIGAVIGTANALLIVKVRLGSPFVITLGMLSVVSGITFVLSGGGVIAGMPSFVDTLGSGFVGDIPNAALVVLGLAAVYATLANLTQWGRWIFAVGGNSEAARRVGIPVDAVSMSVYILNGIAAGVAGVLTAGMTDSGYPTAGQLSELDAISAVIVGGASFAGGRGTVLGALVGALILATIRNGLNLLNVDTNWAPVALGTVLILAVGMDVVRRRLETALRLARAKAESGLEEPESLAPIDPEPLP